MLRVSGIRSWSPSRYLQQYNDAFLVPEKIQLYFIYNQIKDIKEYQKERTIYVHIRRIKKYC